MPLKPRPSENEQEFISRCMSEEKDSFPEEAQRYAICKSKWDRKELSKQKFSDPQKRVMSKLNFEEKYRGINLLAKPDDDPCQTGYRQLGTKMLDGKDVPNCIPEEDHPDTK